VLTWFAVALAGGAAAVAVGWGMRRFDELGRPRRFPWASVAALLALALAAAVPGLARAHQERRLGRAASVLAGARVAVRCQSLGAAFVDGGPELGYVRWRPDGAPEAWALIKRDQCRHLAAYLRSDRHRPSREQVIAVHVLTHEAMHLAGRQGEAAAECAAVQRDALTARLLGSPAADAAGLAAAYWRNLYPLMPPGYRSPECRAGGAMDERLADAPWLAPVPASLFDTGDAGSHLGRSAVMSFTVGSLAGRRGGPGP
jgi:hypothetical protein